MTFLVLLPSQISEHELVGEEDVGPYRQANCLERDFRGKEEGSSKSDTFLGLFVYGKQLFILHTGKIIETVFLWPVKHSSEVKSIKTIVKDELSDVLVARKVADGTGRTVSFASAEPVVIYICS